MPFDIPPPPEDIAAWLSAARNAATSQSRTPPSQWEQIGDDRYPVQQYQPPTIFGIDPLSFIGGRFGFRGMPQPQARGPWSPPEPRPNAPPREWRQPGDDSVGQHVYEAILGRTRGPGESVARPGSGWWMVGRQPIPKPTNVLPWLGLGGIAYGSNRALNGILDSHALEHENNPHDGPGSLYRWMDRNLPFRGRYRSADVTDIGYRDEARRLMTGGVGNAPY